MEEQMELILPRRRAVLITEESVAPEKELVTDPGLDAWHRLDDMELTPWFKLDVLHPPCSGLWNLRDPATGSSGRFDYDRNEDLWLFIGPTERASKVRLPSRHLFGFEWQGLAKPPKLPQASVGGLFQPTERKRRELKF
jgi:hypothetical protein